MPDSAPPAAGEPQSVALQPAPISAGRRRLLKWLSIVLGGVAASLAGLPVLAFFVAPVRQRRDDWIDLGEAGRFPVGQTRLVKYRNPHAKKWDGLTAMGAAYVRRVGETEFVVFAVNCTHLGCPVSWFPQSGLFLCPCHGGVYYADGAHAAGPPPRGLYRYEVKVAKGRLKIKGGHLPTLQDTFQHPA
jgi:Rieske Fe-S protein